MFNKYFSKVKLRVFCALHKTRQFKEKGYHIRNKKQIFDFYTGMWSEINHIPNTTSCRTLYQA